MNIIYEVSSDRGPSYEEQFMQLNTYRLSKDGRMIQLSSERGGASPSGDMTD